MKKSKELILLEKERKLYQRGMIRGRDVERGRIMEILSDNQAYIQEDTYIDMMKKIDRIKQSKQ